VRLCALLFRVLSLAHSRIYVSVAHLQASPRLEVGLEVGLALAAATSLWQSAAARSTAAKART
jgi:hypothetical protein